MLQIFCIILKNVLSPIPFANTETYPIATSSLVQFNSVKKQPMCKSNKLPWPFHLQYSLSSFFIQFYAA